MESKTRKNGVTHFAPSDRPWCNANHRTSTMTRVESDVTCKTCMRSDRMHDERVRRWREAGSPSRAPWPAGAFRPMWRST